MNANTNLQSRSEPPINHLFFQRIQVRFEDLIDYGGTESPEVTRPRTGSPQTHHAFPLPPSPTGEERAVLVLTLNPKVRCILIADSLTGQRIGLRQTGEHVEFKLPDGYQLLQDHQPITWMTSPGTPRQPDRHIVCRHLATGSEVNICRRKKRIFLIASFRYVISRQAAEGPALSERSESKGGRP